MKKTRKMVAILLCLIMVASMAVVASAVTSRAFFNQQSGGYRCTGSGRIDNSTASAIFHATALPMQQILPDADCESEVTVAAYNASGAPLGITTTFGDVDATATYTTALDIIYKIECTFKFNGADLGEYTLYAE